MSVVSSTTIAPARGPSFAERLSDERHAHKTKRLQEALVLVGFARGGRAEARPIQDRGSAATPTHAALRCASAVHLLWLGVEDG